MLVYQPSCVSVSMYTCVRTVCIRPSGVPVFFVCLVGFLSFILAML